MCVFDAMRKTVSSNSTNAAQTNPVCCVFVERRRRRQNGIACDYRTNLSSLSDVFTSEEKVLYWCYLLYFFRGIMSTTSIKLSDELKQRATVIAQNLGITPHAFMVDAIRKASEAAEKQAEFVAQAKAAHKKMVKTGLGFEHDEVHRYLRERIANANANSNATSSTKKAKSTPPKAKSWRG